MNGDIILISNIESIRNKYLSSSQGKYIYNYLKEFSVDGVIIEKYIDKGYLIDYSNYYSRSFKEYPRYTDRIHFFDNSFDEKQFKEIIASNDQSIIVNHYLGYAVIKPVKNIFGDKLIGKTVLKMYPKHENGEIRHYVSVKNKINLFGIPIELDSLPFKTQDIAVGACATTSLWIAAYLLNNLFGTPLLSSYEITKTSFEEISTGRCFPSQGLTIPQMLRFINSINLDFEFIGEDYIDDEFINRLIKAYLNFNLPLIAGLELRKGSEISYHSVLVSGYKEDNEGNIICFYIHDDQIGPYSKTELQGSSFNWKNEWVTLHEYDYSNIDFIIIPVYPKIRVTFQNIYTCLKRKRIEDIITNFEDTYRPHKIKYDIFLEDINDYKKHIIESNITNKVEILTEFLPKYLWVLKIYIDNSQFFDMVYDGTSENPEEELLIVKYN